MRLLQSFLQQSYQHTDISYISELREMILKLTCINDMRSTFGILRTKMVGRRFTTCSTTGRGTCSSIS